MSFWCVTSLVCAGESVHMALPCLKYKTGQLIQQSSKENQTPIIIFIGIATLQS